MGIKIIDSWTREERWSAYDTDTMYYVKALVDGEEWVLSDISPFNAEERIKSQLEKKRNIRLREEVAYKSRKLVDKFGEEALTILDDLLSE